MEPRLNVGDLEINPVRGRKEKCSHSRNEANPWWAQ